MQPSIKAVLFDKDGTLFDFDATWGTWCERVLKRLSPDNEDQRRALGLACGYDPDTNSFLTGSTIVNGAAIDTLHAWQTIIPDLAAEDVNKIAMAELDGLPIKPVCDLTTLMQVLRDQHYVLGVATNDFEEPAKSQLTQAQLTSFFSFIVGSDSGYGSKPQAGMIHGFCDSVGVKPNQVAMVGDSTHDLHAARAAGAFAIGVLTGPAGQNDLAQSADAILESIEMLPAYLDGLRKAKD